jgi:hypothetical protein
MYSKKTPDNGQRKCPKHVEFFDKITFGKFVRLVGFIKKKFVTMHGHMNVKLFEEICAKSRSASSGPVKDLALGCDLERITPKYVYFNVC